MPRPRKLVYVAEVKNRPFQIRYKDPNTGKTVRMSSRTTDIKEAERMAKDIEAKLTLGIPITNKPTKQLTGPHMPWQEFRNEYSTRKLTGSRGAADAELRLDVAERIVKPKTLGDMTERETLYRLQAGLLAGKASRNGRPRASATVNSYTTAVVAALNWAADQKWIAKVDGIAKVDCESSDDMKGRPLTDEEFTIMLAAVPQVVGREVTESWRHLLRGVVASGLRLSELLNISWDIRQTIQPRWRGASRPVLYFPAHLHKSKKKQEIPLCPWFEELLEKAPAEHRTGWVFNPGSLLVKRGRKYNRRLKPHRVGQVVSLIGKQAGIIVDEGNARTGAPVKFASCHDLRRTFATRLRESDLSVHLIQTLMRHADYRTTQRFYLADTTQRDAERIAEQLGHRSNQPVERNAMEGV